MDLHLTSDTLSECKGAESDSGVVESTANSSSDSDTPIIKRFRFRAVFTLDPIPDGIDSTLVWDNSFPAKLNESLLRARERAPNDKHQLPNSVAAYLTMTSLETTAGYFKSLSLIEDAASEDINILDQIFLSALPAPTSFQFILAIEHPADEVQFTGNNLKVNKLKDDSYALEMWMDIPEKLGITWEKSGKMTSGLIIRLSLQLDDAAVGAVCFGKMALLKLFRDKLNFGRRLFGSWSEILLSGNTGSDMVIRVGDKAIKLHKSILSERSPELMALLKVKKDNFADIFGEMTEAGVQALLKFIYSWDLGDAWKSCDIALELLKAGIQLKMEDLTDAMEQLICFMPFNWFSSEMALATLQLVELRRALNDGESLKKAEKKCLDFGKWCSTDNYQGMSGAEGQHPTFWDKNSSKVECHFVERKYLIFGSGPIRNELTDWDKSHRLNLLPGYPIDKRSNIFWANLLLAQVDDKGMKRYYCSNLKFCLKFGKKGNFVSCRVLIDEDKSSANIFEELAKFPPNCYGFNLDISEYNTYTGSTSTIGLLRIDEKNLKVEKFEDGKFGLELTEKALAETRVGGKHMLYASFSFTLVLDEGIGNALNWMEFVKHRFNKWSGMLQNGLGIPTDLVIRAGDTEKNGEGIKCHKFVLSERSSVFKAMLEVDMMEGRNGCVEIGDMTEAVVKAMLPFVYGRDLQEAWKECGVAFELLEAGHKYEMEDLVEAMVGVVGAMPFEWFRKDVAVEMAKFAGMVGGKLEKVGENCLDVLKWIDDKEMIKKQEEAIKKQEEMIKKRYELNKKRDEVIKNQEEVIKKHEEVIKKQEELIKKQEEVIKKQGEAIKKRDEQNKKRDEVIKKQGEVIKKLEETIKKQNEIIGGMKSFIRNIGLSMSNYCNGGEGDEARRGVSNVVDGKGESNEELASKDKQGNDYHGNAFKRQKLSAVQNDENSSSSEEQDPPDFCECGPPKTTSSVERCSRCGKNIVYKCAAIREKASDTRQEHGQISTFGAEAD